jgi:uncharacterized metal-binding protein YceD (DUF177 family)
MSSAPAVEFSRPVLLARVGTEPYRQEIAASETERAALARRFDLVALDRLDATVELVRRGADLFLLRARFNADFAQSCVITLEPVAASLCEDFTLLYGPPEVEGQAAGAVEDDIAFEPLAGDRVDIGEAVAQQFSLALPPFPRAPDADLANELPQGPAEAGPFAAALAKLAGRRGDPS